MSESKKEILGQVGHFSMATILTHLVTIVAVFLTRKFLGPLQMGIWAILQVILTYTMYCSFGITYGIVQKVPFYRGKKEFEKADEIRDVVISFSVLTTTMVAAGVIIFAFLSRHKLSGDIFLGLIFLAIIIFLTRINNLLITILRAYKEFILAGRQMFLSAIVNAVLVATLAYSFKLYGFMLATCLSLVFNIGYMWFHFRFPFKWNLNFSLVKELLIYGALLITVDFFGSTVLTADRVVIAKMLGLEAVGLYTIAQMAWTYVFTFPNSISIISATNLQEKFGRNEQIENLKNYVSKSLQALSVVMPLVISMIWILGPPLVRILLPKFIGGVEALKLLVLATFFSALFTTLEQFLIAIKKQTLLLPLGLVWVVCAFSFNFIAIKLGFGIAGVGAAMALTALIRFLVLYGISSSFLFSWRESRDHLLKIFGAFAYFLILVIGLSKISFSVNSLLNQIIIFAIFTLLYLPILLRLNAQLGILPLLINHLSTKFKFKTTTS